MAADAGGSVKARPARSTAPARGVTAGGRVFDIRRMHARFIALALAALAAGCQTRAGEEQAARRTPAADPATLAPGPAADTSARLAVAPEPDRPGPRPAGAIVYRLRFPAPHTHYVEVEAELPAVPTPDAADAMELFMAVWTPGSYLVREHSRHVEGLAASTLDGAPLAVDKVRKNRWRVRLDRAGRVVVRYRVYAREMSVRTSFVDADIAVLNGAPTFITAAGGESLAHEVILEPAPGWPASVTALRPHPDGAPHHYVAPDYDALVDAPIVLGDPQMHGFEVAGVRHRVATFLAGARWDGDRVARDLETMVRAHVALWGAFPYREYVFLGVLSGGRGGLEHRGSTLMIGSPWQTRTRDGYVRWLGLASHELFHAWNVKRLWPRALGALDYEREVYTRSLWVVEGLTSYYDDLLLRRAGLIDDATYLAELSSRIEAVQTAPGRQVQSLAASSFDAWIEHYRQDENSANTTVSYYSKGAVAGFLLDAEIRRRTGGRRSLDDVVRLAYERHAGGRGYTAEDFRAIAAEVAGGDLDGFFARVVDGTGELDYQPALDYHGLRFAAAAAAAAGAGDADRTPGWLGAITRSEEGRLVVDEVRRETPAHAAGIAVDDEILAIDEHRVPSGGLDDLLGHFRPGERVSVVVARRGRLRHIPVTLGRAPATTWLLEPEPEASRQQIAQRKRWLEGT